MVHFISKIVWGNESTAFQIADMILRENGYFISADEDDILNCLLRITYIATLKPKLIAGWRYGFLTTPTTKVVGFFNWTLKESYPLMSLSNCWFIVGTCNPVKQLVVEVPIPQPLVPASLTVLWYVLDLFSMLTAALTSLSNDVLQCSQSNTLSDNWSLLFLFLPHTEHTWEVFLGSTFSTIFPFSAALYVVCRINLAHPASWIDLANFEFLTRFLIFRSSKTIRSYLLTSSLLRQWEIWFLAPLTFRWILDCTPKSGQVVKKLS